MPKFTPFPPASSKYGAQMGRLDTHPALFPQGSDLCVSGPQYEYDCGGAYWGLPGPDAHAVYAVWMRGKGRLGVKYVRAASPDAARAAVTDTSPQITIIPRWEGGKPLLALLDPTATGLGCYTEAEGHSEMCPWYYRRETMPAKRGDAAHALALKYAEGHMRILFRMPTTNQ